MELEYHTSGHWIRCDERADEFIAEAAQFASCSTDEIVAKLESGRRVKLGERWDDEIRKVRPPRPVRPFPEQQERNGLGNEIDSLDY